MKPSFAHPIPRTLLSACALAALLAAPAAWAASSGGDTFLIGGVIKYYVGTNGSTPHPSSGNKDVVYDGTDFFTAAGGISDTAGSFFTDVDPDGKADENELTIASAGKVYAAVGGYAMGTNTQAKLNTLTVNGKVTISATGGHSVDGIAERNTVTLDGSAEVQTVFGGLSEKGNAENNYVFINGGNVHFVYGGDADKGNATGNTVTLAGGVVKEDVMGGKCNLGGCDAVTGNGLTLKATGLTVGGKVENFDTLKLELPNTVAANDIVLDVTGNADFSKLTAANFSFKLADGATLKKGDEIYLIKSSGTLTTALPSSLAFTAGGHPFAVKQVGSDLVAEVTVHHTVTVSPAEGGTVDCGSATEVADGGTVTCTATAQQGYTLEKLEISDGVNPPASCTTSPSCTATLPSANDDVTVTATFSKDSDPTPPQPDPTPDQQPPQPRVDSSSPTMGELGLLLSSLALAGAAAPALRRRERKARKQD